MPQARYLSDAEISASYDDFEVTEVQLWDNRTSGGMQVELPHGESRWDNFIRYDDGRIAFEHWYPEPVYMALADIATAAIAMPPCGECVPSLTSLFKCPTCGNRVEVV